MRVFSLLLLLVCLAGPLVAQSTHKTLETVTREMEAHPNNTDPQWTVDLESAIQSASLDEIREALPSLVGLSESPDEHLRANSLLALTTIAGRNKGCGERAASRTRRLRKR